MRALAEKRKTIEQEEQDLIEEVQRLEIREIRIKDAERKPERKQEQKKMTGCIKH